MALRISMHNSGGELDHIVTTPSSNRAKDALIEFIDRHVSELHPGDKFVVEDTSDLASPLARAAARRK